jgi:5-methylcytosine-specific restriction endonuclease McrA
MKACSNCKEIKPLDGFHRHKYGKNGYRAACKVCRKATTAEYNERKKEHRQEYAKEYYAKNKTLLNKKSRVWREENKEHLSKLKMIYHEKNKEALNAKKRENYHANREQWIAKAKVWREKNPEKKLEANHRRRAKARQNGVYAVSASFMKKLYNSCCIACGSKDRISADHIIPIARGGRHSEGNLQPLCISCNSSKNSKTVMEWKLSMKKSAV